MVTPDKSRVADALEPSSSELSEEVPLLVLSDLPRAPFLSEMESSLDDSGSAPAPPDDCCLRLRYSDMDNVLTLRLTGGRASGLKAGGAGMLFGTTVLGSFNRLISLGLVSSSLTGVSSGFGASWAVLESCTTSRLCSGEMSDFG